MIVIPIENQHSYNHIPRNGALKLDIENHCDSPSRVLLVDWKADCFVCSCEAWLPISVGSITDFNALTDVWQTQSARALQKDINQKKFTHCAVDRCGVQQQSIQHDRYLVSINIDESCNLHCPSCRQQPIMITSGPVFDKKLQQVEHLVDLLEDFDQPCHVVMSGNGDPLASAIMRPLIHRFRPRPNHTIRLFTNGLLLKKQLDDSEILDHVTEYFISIDAGSRDTYERVRLGGSWDRLIENFDWLACQTKDRASVLLMFVLQRNNYQDLDNFCELVLRYGFQGSVTYLEDWGTWADFGQHDVIGNPAHPEHDDAMYHLDRSLKQFGHKINFGTKLRSLLT